MTIFNMQAEFNAEEKTWTLDTVLNELRGEAKGTTDKATIESTLDFMLTNTPLPFQIIVNADDGNYKVISGHEVIDTLVSLDNGMTVSSHVYEDEVLHNVDGFKGMPVRMTRFIKSRFIHVILTYSEESTSMYTELIENRK